MTLERWDLVERRDFVYDDWNLIHEFVSTVDGAVTNVTEIQYFWGLDLSDTFYGAGGVGGLLAVSYNSDFAFPVYDGNGNIMKYIDASGDVVASYIYDDFGGVVEEHGLEHRSSFRFSSKYYERETGTHVFLYRVYSPAMFSWLNRDPIEDYGGLNLYSYCENGWGFDLLGLDKCCCKVCLYSAIEKNHASPSEPLTIDDGLSGHTWLNVEACDSPEGEWVDSTVQYSFGPKEPMENSDKNFLVGVPGGKWNVAGYKNAKYRVVKKCWEMDADECKKLKNDPAFKHGGSFSMRRYCTNTTLDLLRRHGFEVPNGIGPVQVGDGNGFKISQPNPKHLAEQLHKSGGYELNFPKRK